MKWIGILVIGVVLTGCGSQLTLEELEDQAVITGDWSEVEKREALLLRIAQRHPERYMQCPDGATIVCENAYGKRSCGCVDRTTMRETFAGRWERDWR